MFTLIIEDKHGGVADEYTFDEGEFLVGRSQDADIILPADNVSRRHARLYTVDGVCYVEDLGSSNGVFVNGRRIHDVYQIDRTAQIKVGDYYLHVDGGRRAVEEQARVHCRLRGQNLDFTGQVFEVDRNVTLVGRGKDCSLTFIDGSISRMHAKITIERDGSLMVEDLNSSNGSYIDGERIDSARLRHGSLVRFGNAEFVVELPEHARDAGPWPTTGVSTPAIPAAGGGIGRTALILAVVVAVVTAVALLLVTVVFDDGDQPTAPGGGAEAQGHGSAADKPAEATPEQKIAAFAREAGTLTKSLEWEQAIAAWEKVREIDPLHEEATSRINKLRQVIEAKTTLAEAVKLRDEKRYGEAVRKLRSIAEDNYYYSEARDELRRLEEMKPSLLMQADALVKVKDCKPAIKLYRDALQIDPEDATLTQKLNAIEDLPASRCKH